MHENAIPGLAGKYWETAPEPADGEFHIGLVMSGAVSAGAFTAGVIDFLTEALDAWEEQKAKQAASSPDSATWAIPGHQVKIRIMAGASAGSITAAIAAAALHYQFPHVPKNTPYSKRQEVGCENNPFYKAWVTGIDIRYLLGDKDFADAGSVKSILDSTILDDIANAAIGYVAELAPKRSYLSKPVRYVFTLGNLRGTPYFLDLTGGTGAGLGMVAHADYVSYCVTYGSGDPTRLYDDDRLLPYPNSAKDTVWAAFAQSALASGAFPMGLAARHFERNPTDYGYRFALVPRIDAPGTIAKQLVPYWPNGILPTAYKTMVVDGGTMNNDPFEIARVELAGYTGRNPRNGSLANRAVVMIDPFPDKANDVDDPMRGQKDDLLHAGLALLDAWKDQARFKPLDIALAEDDQVHSRFIICPSRDGSQDSNQCDMACGGLGGFSGFLDEEYRHHDYMLGRRNCQWFLKTCFILPTSNEKVFRSINPKLKDKNSPWLISRKGIDCLPIIPLLGKLADEEELPTWPQGILDLKRLRDKVDSRFAKVIKRLLKTTAHLNFFEEIAAKLCLNAVRKNLVNKVMSSVAADSEKRKLKTSATA
jgi:hypothetical protein